jgi:hypothetical protein
VQAQWLNQPIAGAPSTPDGKVNMTGPVPRLNGKPDLSGIWQVEAEPSAPGGLFGLGESPNSKYFRDILSDFNPGEESLTPAGAEMLRGHTQAGGSVSPSSSTTAWNPKKTPRTDQAERPGNLARSPRQAPRFSTGETKCAICVEEALSGARLRSGSAMSTAGGAFFGNLVALY